MESLSVNVNDAKFLKDLAIIFLNELLDQKLCFALSRKNTHKTAKLRKELAMVI